MKDERRQKAEGTRQEAGGREGPTTDGGLPTAPEQDVKVRARRLF
jgi:hypothetical protein